MTVIREIQLKDAGQFLSLCHQLDQETDFMLLEPGERLTTLAQQEDSIRALLAHANQTILVAEDDPLLVGYIAGFGGEHKRSRHKAEVIIGIMQAYTGQGLGQRLFSALEQWAHEQGLHKLELTVMAHNKRAINLYRKMGFVVEGISVDSLLVHGRYVDELDMAKILTRP